MTIKQLRVSHRSYLREFNRAVIRRRKNIQRVMVAQLNARRTSRRPNNSTTRQAVALKRRLLDTLYRSVMNKASNAKCGRWTRNAKGWWGCTNCDSSRAMKRRCRA